MGFRSTFVTQNAALLWPEWFVNKYKNSINFPYDVCELSSKYECKEYSQWSELCTDIQKCFIELDRKPSSYAVLVFVHECTGITRVMISNNKIIYLEPITWVLTKGCTHNYCYSCEKDYENAPTLDN